MTWDVNSYESPDKIAQAMAKMILPTDKRILEPCAGTGQIAKAIVDTQNHLHLVLANEISASRCKTLALLGTKKLAIKHSDYLTIDSPKVWDLIVTNPPFDCAIAFIKKSLEVLNDKPESRLIFLLPISFFSSQGRSKEFNELDCHIAGITIITGRIDYLKDGIPMSKCQKEIDGIPQFKNGKPVMMSGRQESDCIFTIKKGKNPNSLINFLF